MTRINCIPPNELTREHLIAEYRELPRTFKLALKAHERGWKQTIDSYRLGRGHVEFFYDKLAFLRNRHQSLVVEMKARGYTTNIDCSQSGVSLPTEFQKDWIPTKQAKDINYARIQERLKKTKE